jgi:hypothetical protein
MNNKTGDKRDLRWCQAQLSEEPVGTASDVCYKLRCLSNCLLQGSDSVCPIDDKETNQCSDKRLLLGHSPISVGIEYSAAGLDPPEPGPNLVPDESFEKPADPLHCQPVQPVQLPEDQRLENKTREYEDDFDNGIDEEVLRESNLFTKTCVGIESNEIDDDGRAFVFCCWTYISSF